MKKVTAFLTAAAIAASAVVGTLAAFAEEPANDTQTQQPTTVYAIKNGTGSCIALEFEVEKNDSEYKVKKVTSKEMFTSGTEKNYVSVKNVQDLMYLPFRYIFEDLLKLEEKEAGKEEKELGKEEKESGTEEKESGTEEKESGTEEKELGKEETEAGTEEKESGTEEKELGKEEKESGTEETELGKEEKESGTEGKESGTEETDYFNWESSEKGVKINYKIGKSDEQSIEASASINKDAFIDGSNSTYVAFRKLEEQKSLSVYYDSSTDALFITKDTDVDAKLIEAVKLKYREYFNDNYATYSYAYATAPQGEAKELMKDGKRCYCVNQYGDMLVYVDPDFHLKIGKISEVSEPPIGNIEFSYIENGKPLTSDKIVDKIIFDGRRIYGIELDKPSDEAGDIFVGELNINDGRYADIERGKYVVDILYRSDNIDARYLLYKTTEENAKYLYFIDYNDSEKIKVMITYPDKKDMENAEIKPVVDNNNKPLEKITHFDICGDDFIYNHYKNGVYTAKFLTDEKGKNIPDRIGTANPVIQGEDLKLNGLISDWSDKAEYKFYFIKDSDTLCGIKNEDLSLDEIKTGGQAIRNIAIINGKLYGREGDEVNLKTLWQPTPTPTEAQTQTQTQTTDTGTGTVK